MKETKLILCENILKENCVAQAWAIFFEQWAV